MSTLALEYWLDPLCIWAFVGRNKVDCAVAEHGGELDIRHRVVPIFGSLPHRFSEGSWAKGGIEGRVAATVRVASAHGHPEVTGEVWRSDTPASSWAPSLAIKAVTEMERLGQSIS